MSPGRKVGRSGAAHTDEERRERANILCRKENNLFLLPLTEEWEWILNYIKNYRVGIYDKQSNECWSIWIHYLGDLCSASELFEDRPGRKNVNGDPGERLCDNMNSYINSSFSLFSRFWWNGLCNRISREYRQYDLRSKHQSSLWYTPTHVIPASPLHMLPWNSLVSYSCRGLQPEFWELTCEDFMSFGRINKIQLFFGT